MLSAQVQEARIFDLTDAMAQRNPKRALDILHDLLADGEPPDLGHQDPARAAAPSPAGSYFEGQLVMICRAVRPWPS